MQLNGPASTLTRSLILLADIKARDSGGRGSTILNPARLPIPPLSRSLERGIGLHFLAWGQWVVNNVIPATGKANE
jgi:hypothetical protein